MVQTRLHKHSLSKAEQAVSNVASRASVRDPIDEFQEVYGSRAASADFRQQLGSDFSSSPQIQPPIQAKPSFRGLSHELAAESQSVQLREEENKTGLPDDLKAGVESLSGYSMDDVRVHYNSSKPAQLQALAYTQGTEIHVGPGQEKHLAHEAWHVVQQMQRRVKPTIQIKGIQINDDDGLEREADEIGGKAVQKRREMNTSELIHESQQTQKAKESKRSTMKKSTHTSSSHRIPSSHSTVQRVKTQKYVDLKKSKDSNVVWHKNLGKELVATYRIMSTVATAMRQDKNKTALKDAAIGLARVGISVATMLSAIPDLTEGTDILHGDIVVNTGLETIGQQAGETGTEVGLDLLETRDVNPDIERGVQQTTTGGVLRGKIHDKVGTLKNACQTLLHFVPFFGAAKLLYSGFKKAAQSQDEWNKQKGKLFRYIREIEDAMQEAILEVDLESFGDMEIVTANKINVFNHSRRTLKQVLEKYKEKSKELREVCEEFIEKHGEHVGLRTLQYEDEWG